MFQVLNSHMWLVAEELDSGGLGPPSNGCSLAIVDISGAFSSMVITIKNIIICHQGSKTLDLLTD